ncbi:hypothetical protein PYW07_003398 [Mythimna separata]|uniref:Sialomucin core protein 24 n=1 Tax=Mythimna separata TaxID=271217 RepID=A0AAD8DR73_MYTSE|nr:hypothetical protein PYW07_003398 [Mythimna separata]
MKQVIFVCLLSVLVSLSQQAAPLDATTQTVPVPPQNGSGNDTKHNETKIIVNNATVTDPPTAQTDNKTTTVNPTQTQNTTQVGNETSTQTTNDSKPSEKNTPTEAKPAADVTTVKPVDPAKEKNETKPATPVPTTNGTTPSGKEKNETTTPKGENVSPTPAPVELKSRAFDGPSFIGGIILTLGLLAIGFMGFKYYKNQTERNYHTL